jgi:hypothetical protein
MEWTLCSSWQAWRVAMWIEDRLGDGRDAAAVGWFTVVNVAPRKTFRVKDPQTRNQQFSQSIPRLKLKGPQPQTGISSEKVLI